VRIPLNARATTLFVSNSWIRCSSWAR